MAHWVRFIKGLVVTTIQCLEKYHVNFKRSSMKFYYIVQSQVKNVSKDGIIINNHFISVYIVSILREMFKNTSPLFQVFIKSE